MQEVFLKDLADVDHHIQEKGWHVGMLPASKVYKYTVSSLPKDLARSILFQHLERASLSDAVGQCT